MRGLVDRGEGMRGGVEAKWIYRDMKKKGGKGEIG